MLGRGAFSRVVREGPNAVKIIDVEDQRPPHNWRAEIAALRELSDCKNVVPLLNVTESMSGLDREVRLHMPCYALTLEQVIFREAKANYPPGSGWRNAMSPTKIVTILTGIASALAAAHEHGIIHRDVKPENIMFLEENGVAVLESLVLIDFGVSYVPSVRAPFETAESKVCDIGTGEYKAPEALYGLNYSRNIDIWSLGCIAARLISSDSAVLFSPYNSDLGLISAQFQLLGRPQISKCPSIKDTAVAHMASNEPQVSNLRLGRLANNPVMQQLLTMTQQMLSYEPQSRPTAKELLQALSALSE